MLREPVLKVPLVRFGLPCLSGFIKAAQIVATATALIFPVPARQPSTRAVGR